MLLSVSELRRTYKRGETAFSAVEDVSFAVSGEDFVCITGKSGSGKSTLLHLLTGLLRPDGGAVVLEGRNLASLSDGERSRLRSERIGCIPQGYSLLNSFSVLDNVCLPCNPHERDRIPFANRYFVMEKGRLREAGPGPPGCIS
jgi:putative ABC transport system ATP-binding protein